jgi:hypothetical protein
MREAGRPAAEEDALRDAVFQRLTIAERTKSAYRRLRYGGTWSAGA